MKVILTSGQEEEIQIEDIHHIENVNNTYRVFRWNNPMVVVHAPVAYKIMTMWPFVCFDHYVVYPGADEDDGIGYLMYAPTRSIASIKPSESGGTIGVLRDGFELTSDLSYELIERVMKADGVVPPYLNYRMLAAAV